MVPWLFLTFVSRSEQSSEQFKFKVQYGTRRASKSWNWNELKLVWTRPCHASITNAAVYTDWHFLWWPFSHSNRYSPTPFSNQFGSNSKWSIFNFQFPSNHQFQIATTAATTIFLTFIKILKVTTVCRNFLMVLAALVVSLVCCRRVSIKRWSKKAWNPKVDIEKSHPMNSLQVSYRSICTSSKE